MCLLGTSLGHLCRETNQDEMMHMHLERVFADQLVKCDAVLYCPYLHNEKWEQGVIC